MHEVLPQAGRHLCSLDSQAIPTELKPVYRVPSLFRWPMNQSSPQPVAVELVMFPCTLNLPIRERRVETPVLFWKNPWKRSMQEQSDSKERTTHAVGCPIRENAPHGSASALLIHKCLPVPSHLCSQAHLHGPPPPQILRH